MRTFLPVAFSAFLFFACSPYKKIGQSAQQTVLADSALQTAHVGISIYEPAAGKYWYNYQGDKYFVPASNTKIPTCYAAMKYLGDSLVGLRYKRKETYYELFGTGDPTFLHKDFITQPILSFIESTLAARYYIINDNNFRDEKYGSGWSWNDYNESYMVEKSGFPIYGNVLKISRQGVGLQGYPSFFLEPKIQFIDPMYPIGPIPMDTNFSIVRNKNFNAFDIQISSTKFVEQTIPFITDKDLVSTLIHDTLYNLFLQQKEMKKLGLENVVYKIHSQPTDSLLKPMMHRSDNFFAEQSLLMVSNEFLGYMNDAKIIDTLLKTDFKDLPQKPRWADGSGLSRYNLFTPQDFVFILNKMKNEFGMNRIKEIFPTGGEGTISSYYKKDSTFIYAKTGTLSGVVALSGFLYTKKGKELIFSVLVNNHQGSATNVRRAVEKFIQGIRENF